MGEHKPKTVCKMCSSTANWLADHQGPRSRGHLNADGSINLENIMTEYGSKPHQQYHWLKSDCSQDPREKAKREEIVVEPVIPGDGYVSISPPRKRR